MGKYDLVFEQPSKMNRVQKTRFNCISKEVLHAEVLWVIKVITSHCLFNSHKDISCLFFLMFPDNQIAQSFSYGATKYAYLACFGIYPYFHELLIKKIRAVKYYTLLFDESLNQINQKKQMDMIVRFWDSKSNKVTERYFNSEFFGHATAADMLAHLKNGMALLNLLTVSDGLCSFLPLLTKYVCLCQIIQINN